MRGIRFLKHWVAALLGRSPDIKVMVEPGPYKIGDTIELSLELRCPGDVQVSKGSVELVCEERYKRTFTVTKEKYNAVRGGGPRDPMPIITPLPTTTETKEVTEKRKDRFVHSYVDFITDVTLRQGAHRHRVRLKVRDEHPPHAELGTVTWEIVARLEVVDGLDVTRKQRIEIELS